MNESTRRRAAIAEALGASELEEALGAYVEFTPIGRGLPPLHRVVRHAADPGPSAPTHKTPSGVANTSDRNGVRGLLLPSRELRVTRPDANPLTHPYIPHTRTRAEMMQVFAIAREKRRGDVPFTSEERRIEMRAAHRQARVDAKRTRLERQRKRRAMNAMRETMKRIARSKAEQVQEANGLALSETGS